jgi:hypothetical protein
MVPHAPPVIAPPPVLRLDWKTLAWLASMWSKPLNLNTCPMSSSLRRFCGATDKPKSAWFWGPNQGTDTVTLRPKLSNRSYRFYGPNRETRLTGFEVKLEKIITTGFVTKSEKTIWVVLRSNHSQTVTLGFEVQPRSMYSSSPCARCRPHTAPPDLSIT